MLALFKNIKNRRTLLCLSAAAILWGGLNLPVAAAVARPTIQPVMSSGDPASASKEAQWSGRRQIYEQMSAATGIPWFRFAAIDQYERTLAKKGASGQPVSTRLTAIKIPAPVWAGPLNPDQGDTSLNPLASLMVLAVMAQETALLIQRMMRTFCIVWLDTY